MTDAEKLRDISTYIALTEYRDAILRAADLLDAVPPETLAALKGGTWKAVPVEPTEEMIKAAANGEDTSPRGEYCAMLASAPAKPEG